MGSDIKIRPLTIEDRDTVSSIIEKLVAELKAPELLRLMVTDPEAKDTPGDQEAPEARYAVLVTEIIERAIKYLSGDVRAWFSSLVGVTPEEFKKLPWDTEIFILEQLVEVEKADRFFSRLLALFSGIKGYAEGLRTKSDK